MSRILRPPRDFGLHTRSQAASELQDTPFSVFFRHRHFLLILSRYSTILGGILRVHMGYIISKVINEFNRVSLLPWFSIHREEDSLRSTFLTTAIRSDTDGLVVTIGSPKFVNSTDPMEHCSICANWFTRSSYTLRGIIIDL